MNRIELEASHRVRREIRNVRGDDDIRVGFDGCGHHMSIIAIGKKDTTEMTFVTRYERVGNCPIHQEARSFELIGTEIGSIA